MILLVGTSHKTAPVSVREQLAVSQQRLCPLLTQLHQCPDIDEVFCLSTCNRVELYVASFDDSDAAMKRAVHAIEAAIDQHHSPHGSVAPFLYRLSNEQAVNHLFRVAASLDSLVVGEAQVLGQVKRAFDTAIQCRTIGPLLGRAIQWSLHVAKRVRSETRIGQGAVSIANVSAQLAKHCVAHLPASVVTLVGAGHMAQLAARYLDHGDITLHIVNRGFEKAQQLASRCGAAAHPWSELARMIEVSDIVITSTGAQEHIVTASMIKSIQRRRQSRPLCLIDIAVPRNIDPGVVEVPNVVLHDMDSLKTIAGQGADDRHAQARIGEQIIAQETRAFCDWMESRRVTPAIVGLRNAVRDALQTELERSLGGRLRHLTEDDRKALRDMIHAAANKATHLPCVRLKAAACSGNARPLLESLQHLFALRHPSDDDPRCCDQPPLSTEQPDSSLGPGMAPSNSRRQTTPKADPVAANDVRQAPSRTVATTFDQPWQADFANSSYPGIVS